MGASPNFSFRLNERSLVEVSVFEKNQCSCRRAGFFIRKTKLDLKLLILVGGRTAGKKKTGRNFGSSFGKLLTTTFFFFEKKM